MAMDNTGGIRDSQQAAQLRNALSGTPVQRRPEEQTQATGAAAGGAQDQAQVSGGATATALRETNRAFEAVQSRAVAAQVESEALTSVREEIVQLRGDLQDMATERVSPDRLSQVITRVNQLAEEARFNNVPLLSDFSAESLGLTRMTPDMERQEMGQILQNASGQVNDRLREVRQEEAVDRREMERLNVAMENLNAAMNSERLENERDLQQAVDRVQEGLRQRPEPGGNLSADRVMELI